MDFKYSCRENMFIPFIANNIFSMVKCVGMIKDSYVEKETSQYFCRTFQEAVADWLSHLPSQCN